MNRKLVLPSFFVLLVLLAGCGPAGSLRSFTVGDELAYYDFSNSNQFEQGTYSVASLLIRDGVYRIDVREGDNEIWWGQWGDVYENVVIDVDVEQLSERPENAYGIMCRVRGRIGQPVELENIDAPTPEALPELPTTEEPAAETEPADTQDNTESTAEAAAETETAEATPDAEASETESADASATEDAGAEDSATESDETAATSEATAEGTLEVLPATVLEQSNGDGYLFLIQGGGSYGIFRARGRDLTPLVNWQTSDAITPGPAQNHLRAVCMGDYLGFYVNDRLVAEATDNTYQRGQVGLAASAANRLGVLIEFDNLTVSAVNPG